MMERTILEVPIQQKYLLWVHQQSGAYTLITISSNGPSKLYYYCANHSSMGGDINKAVDTTTDGISEPLPQEIMLLQCVPDSIEMLMYQVHKV